MELIVMDRNFQSLAVIDQFQSLIWTDRYWAYGDFELVVYPSEKNLKFLVEGNYLYLRESEHVMIIEDAMLSTNAETGALYTLTGRSLESLLDRRIVWKQTTLDSKIQTAVKRLLTENILAPEDLSRKFERFSFQYTDDPVVDVAKVRSQFTGTNLYEAIQGLCEKSKIGFRVSLVGDEMIFSLYSGVDRSYTQDEIPYVIFSPEYDNIMSTEYISSKKLYKTVALVAGEDQGSTRRTVKVFVPGETNKGLDRRELFVDARDIQSEDADGGVISDADYEALLLDRGEKKLSECEITKTFDGEAIVNKMFVYGEDFFMGDIVQLKNEYGFESRSRVTELVFSQNEAGISTYPTFVNEDKIDEEIEEGEGEE